ncbi:hypothetical protein MED121_01470 [Marinomonas sp. MED121]|uniref:hypothetical protein n=1 Tax=Marinomonas sp. MED121 TaxID=314277 RepID=UPI0000690B5E|nr:hypothetical protein [Marinomonas sp. MED121]EAQ65839.1 hypothetical protein MED121_01470 [Marinomonas sp. MED121]
MAKLYLEDGLAVSLIEAILAAYSKPDQKIIFDKVGNDLIEGFSPNGSTKRRLSKLKHDPEMLAYIITLPLETMTQREVLEISINKFGKERAPSKTSFNRSWSWLIQQRNQSFHDDVESQSVKNIPPKNELYNKVKAGFILQGSSLARWCLDNDVARQNAAQALKGIWAGPKSSELKQRILDSAGLTMEDLAND